MEKRYDVIIVGAGAAGMSAALFTSRRDLRTLVISKDLGGQTASTTLVENYPGIFSIDGRALMEQFHEHAVRFGAEFIFSEVSEIEKDPQGFMVKTFKETYHARAIILASGLSPRDLGVLGEKEFKDRGIFFDVMGREAWWKKKIVGVVGGGSSACTFALKIAAEAEKLYLIHRTEQFRAEPLLLQQIKNFPQVEFIVNAQVKEIRGDEFLNSVIIDQKGEEKKIALHALFVAIGFQPRVAWIKNIVPCNQKNEVVVAEDGSTLMEGIFAAGDIASTNSKQIVVAAGDGCRAALAAHEYLCKKDGKGFVLTDWS